MTKPNLYLINGPLGAGKTTTLKYLLNQPAFARARVIENEFASTSIDTQTLHDHTAEVKTIAGVCICCSNGEELVDALHILADASPDPVIIEATGVANSLKLIEKLVVGDIFDRFELAHGLFVLDGAECTPEQLAAYRDELRAADTVLVSKLDLISAPALQSLTELLHNDKISFNSVDNGMFNVALLNTPSKMITAFAEFDGIIKAHDEGTNYTIVIFDDTLDGKKLEGGWTRLRDTYQLRRMKGDFYDGATWWHVEATPSQCRISQGVQQQSQLVLIGTKARNITRETLLEVTR